MLADQQGKRNLNWQLLFGYAALVFCLLPVRPLWLDELLEVVGSTGVPLREVVTGYAAHSAGQSPLAAVEQAIAIKLFGFSSFVARIPAALAAILGCAGMLLLGKRLNFRHAWMPFIVLASFPIVLRYAAEDRPYSQVLCVAVWLAVVFVDCLTIASARSYLLYTALLIVGVYTQPYLVFIAASHVLFLAIRRRWALVVRFSLIVLFAGAVYLPWYLHSRTYWRQEVEVSALHFRLEPKLPLLILRELAGSGYAGSILLIMLSVYGLRVLSRLQGDWSLWVTSFVMPLCLVVAADLVFDYFFAIRQVIFVLPSLAVMAAAGLERLFGEKGRGLATACCVVVVALNIGYAIRWFTKPGEDWSAAAQRMSQEVGANGCFVPLPAGTGAYYEFFRPDLRGRECGVDLSKARRIAVAISPYLPDRNAGAELDERLQRDGFMMADKRVMQPEVRLYLRRSE